MDLISQQLIDRSVGILLSVPLVATVPENEEDGELSWGNEIIWAKLMGLQKILLGSSHTVLLAHISILYLNVSGPRIGKREF